MKRLCRKPQPGVEDLPIEIIGQILHQLREARDVVAASATCKKWREAWRYHTPSLSFDSMDWPTYRKFDASGLEIIITQTILQTRGLQSLSILMDDVEFSAAPVIAWLMHTRETLKKLHYDVRTASDVNIIEKCGRQKLEDLVLLHVSITGVEPSYQKFPNLKSILLCYVNISVLDLRLLLNACPTLEKLSLVSLDIAMLDAHDYNLDLRSPSLKDFYITDLSLNKLMLEVNNLDILHLKDCGVNSLELINKGALKTLAMDNVNILGFDTGDNVKNVKEMLVRNFTMKWSKMYSMIEHMPKLKIMQMVNVEFDDEDESADMSTVAFSSSMAKLMKMYPIVEFQFEKNQPDGIDIQNQGSTHDYD